MGEFLSLVAAFFFGSSNVFVRQGGLAQDLTKYQGLMLTLLVNNAINLLLFPIFYFFLSPVSINLQGILYLIGSGFCTSFAGRILLYESIERIGASRATTVKITAPAFTVILGLFVLHEAVSSMALLGIFIVLMGILAVSRETEGMLSNGNVQQSDQAALKKGLIIGLLAGLSFGTGNVFRKLGVGFFPYPLLAVAISSFFSLAFLLIFSAFFSQKVDIKTICCRKIFNTKSTMPYIHSGIMTSLALYTVFSALHFSPVTIVNSIAASESLATIFISSLIIRKSEMLNFKLVVSSIIVVLGIVLIIVF